MANAKATTTSGDAQPAALPNTVSSIAQPAAILCEATTKAVPRREEDCAVCAVRDWLENRYPVRLVSAASGTTTWKNLGFAL